MKRFLLSVVWVVIAASMSAQSVSVSDFRLLETDLTAITNGTQEIDQNGELAALIKIVTREVGFTFDIGMLGIVGTKQAVGEIWVYVPKRTQKISIFHQQYGVVRNYYFPIPIESGRTYELKLEVQKEEPQIVEKIVEKTITLSGEESAYKSNLVLAESGDAAAQYYVGYALYNGIGVEQNYKEAVTWLKKAVEQDNSGGQYYLGLCYENGTGIEKDEGEAFRLYSKSAKTQAQAMYRLAICYYQGKGVEKNVKKAFSNCQTAANKNVPEAMCLLGKMFFNGEAVKKDYSTAVKWYRKAINAGDVEAMCALGDCFLLGNGIKTNMEEAISWYEKAFRADEEKTIICLGVKTDVSDDMKTTIRQAFDSAWKGSAEDQYFIGKLFYDEQYADRHNTLASYWLTKAASQNHVDAEILLGDYLMQNKKEKLKAFHWYKQAAEQGSKEALYRVGDCYKRGGGIKKNLKEAVNYYEQSAEKGYSKAMWQLGDCYRLGIGVKNDMAKGIEWYETAAKQNDVELQYLLGNYYLGGREIPKDEKAATRWYEKAAELGHVEAQILIARCYEQGIGVEENAEKAFKWYQKATESERAEAYLQVGKCYLIGFGVKKDEDEAERWFSKAEDIFNSEKEKINVRTMDIESLIDVAICRLKNINPEKEPTIAFSCLNEAVKRNSAEAMLILGYCYEKGLGTEQDNQKAQHWYEKAGVHRGGKTIEIKEFGLKM